MPSWGQEKPRQQGLAVRRLRLPLPSPSVCPAPTFKAAELGLGAPLELGPRGAPLPAEPRRAQLSVSTETRIPPVSDAALPSAPRLCLAVDSRLLPQLQSPPPRSADPCLSPPAHHIQSRHAAPLSPRAGNRHAPKSQHPPGGLCPHCEGLPLTPSAATSGPAPMVSFTALALTVRPPCQLLTGQPPLPCLASRQLALLAMSGLTSTSLCSDSQGSRGPRAPGAHVPKSSRFL